jgi:crotonobetainyl-CoA:carnitine CoA-transferase CaiB-like acyl-CoA transferase
MMLADLGAEVIKVENPTQGDDTRKWGPPFPDKKGTDAYYYMSMNRNKKSMTLNLKKEEGKEVLKELVKSSDIFLHNFIHSKTPDLSVDYDTLSKINPGIIYASVSGYGDKGPMSGKGALDFPIQAMSGLMSITGEKGGSPYKVGFAVTDVMTGQILYSSILAALYAKQADPEKKGMKVDASLLHSAMYGMCYVPFSYLNAGFNYTRIGNNHPNIVPYGSYQTKDGIYLIIAAATEQLFKKLCKQVDISDEEYSKWNNNKIRTEKSDEFNEFLQSKISNYTKDIL